MRLPPVEKLQEEKRRLETAMSQTDSDMFEYYAMQDWWRLHEAEGFLLKRQQAREMREWNL